MSKSRHIAQRVPSGSHSMKKCYRKQSKRMVRKTWKSENWTQWDNYINPVCKRTIYDMHYW